MAPEVIRHESYSFMADVYSYALVVWQLVTHEIPFQNMSQLEAAGKVAIEDARPPFPANTPELIMALIEMCWSQCPDDRLQFPQIAIELKEIHKVLSDKDKEWLRSASGHPVYAEDRRQSLSAGGPSCSSRGSSRDSRRSDSKKSDNDNKPKRRGSTISGLFSLFQKR